MPISKLQPMRPALDACIDAFNEGFDPYVEAAVQATEAATEAAAAANAAREGIQTDLAAKADKTGIYSTLTAGGTTPDSVTDAMLKQTGGVLDAVEVLQDAIDYVPISMTSGYYIQTGAIGTTLDLTTPTANQIWKYALLPVSSGDKFTINGTGSSSSTARIWCFTDSNGIVLSVWPYSAPGTTVNEVITAPANGYLIVNTKGGETSYKGIAPSERLTPLEMLFNTASYRPLGSLSKGYICLTCDDGENALATYTIPMLKSKNVPCTFGLFSTSPVLANSTYLALIQEMVSDYGCCVAQHGATNSWTDDANAMYELLTTEKAALVNAGLTPRGAIMPGASSGTAYITNVMKSIAGGMFGCVTAESITNEKIVYGTMSNGCRTNQFALQRISAESATYPLNVQKAMIDAAITNNWLLIPFWHDASIAASAEKQARLEELIDYAISSGITFCTLADIPTLI